MLHRELPRERKFVKDSCPGVSITSRPGILYSCVPSYTKKSVYRYLYLKRFLNLIHNSSFLFDSLNGKVRRTDLLCYTSGLTLLYIGLTDLVGVKSTNRDARDETDLI